MRGKKPLAVVMGFGAGLILGEAVILLAGLAPEVAFVSVGRFRLSGDPQLGYEPIPHFAYEGDDLYFYEFRGSSNGLGMRDREHPIAKLDGEYRIAMLGDSITMGLYIEATSDVYTHRLAAGLSETHPGVRVMNFGVSGYNSSQEVRTLETKALAYEPDLVVLQYCMNDRRSRDGGIVKELRAREERRAELDPRWVSPLLSHSALYRFVRWNVFGGDLVEAKTERARGLTRLRDDSVEQAFAKLAELSADHRFDVLVVVFPRLRKPRESDAAEYEWVAALSNRQGFHHLDLSQALASCRKEGQISHDSLHPNARGHACAAREIRRVLLDTWLTPAAAQPAD